MKLTLVGSPEEIAEFLALRATPPLECSSSPSWPPLTIGDETVRFNFPTLDFGKFSEPPKPKPPAQTIEPEAIERMEFGLEQAGAPVDVTAINRQIGELLKSPGFQHWAARHFEAIDAFEPPMLRAKRFLFAQCVKDGKFHLDVLDGFITRFLPPKDPVTFEGDH